MHRVHAWVIDAYQIVLEHGCVLPRHKSLVPKTLSLDGSGPCSLMLPCLVKFASHGLSDGRVSHERNTAKP